MFPQEGPPLLRHWANTGQGSHGTSALPGRKGTSGPHGDGDLQCFVYAFDHFQEGQDSSLPAIFPRRVARRGRKSWVRGSLGGLCRKRGLASLRLAWTPERGRVGGGSVGSCPPSWPEGPGWGYFIPTGGRRSWKESETAKNSLFESHGTEKKRTSSNLSLPFHSPPLLWWEPLAWARG